MYRERETMNDDQRKRLLEQYKKLKGYRNIFYMAELMHSYCQLSPEEEVEIRMALYEIYTVHLRAAPDDWKETEKPSREMLLATLDLEERCLAQNPKSVPHLNRLIELCELLGFSKSADFYKSCLPK